MLVEYRDQIAPKILGQKPDRVFVNPDGTPKTAQTLAWLIRRLSRKHAGIELSPHKFRHLAAKIVLDDFPGAFELVKQLLGHENIKTTSIFTPASIRVVPPGITIVCCSNRSRRPSLGLAAYPASAKASGETRCRLSRRNISSLPRGPMRIVRGG